MKRWKWKKKETKKMAEVPRPPRRLASAVIPPCASTITITSLELTAGGAFKTVELWLQIDGVGVAPASEDLAIQAHQVAKRLLLQPFKAVQKKVYCVKPESGNRKRKEKQCAMRYGLRGERGERRGRKGGARGSGL